MGVWTRHIVDDAVVKEIFVEPMILATPIRLKTFNFCVEKKLDSFLKMKKGGFNIRFKINRVDPRVFSEIIDETHVVLKTINRTNGRTPNISVNKLQRRCRNTV
jgi:hypothetical protein